MSPHDRPNTVHDKARHATARRAMSLSELTVVAAIVGMMGLVAVTRYGGNAVADVGAQGFARRLALDSSQARRRAISSGDNHLLRFSFSGGQATQYALYRREGGSTTLVDEARPVPSSVTVTTGGTTNMEFNYTGEAITSYTITVQGPDRTWTVTVPQVTGKSFVQ